MIKRDSMFSVLNYSSVISKKDGQNHVELRTEARPFMYITKKGTDLLINKFHLNANPHTALVTEYR